MLTIHHIPPLMFAVLPVLAIIFRRFENAVTVAFAVIFCIAFIAIGPGTKPE